MAVVKDWTQFAAEEITRCFTSWITMGMKHLPESTTNDVRNIILEHYPLRVPYQVEDRTRLLKFLNSMRSQIIATTKREVLYQDPTSPAFAQLVTLNTIIDYVEHM